MYLVLQEFSFLCFAIKIMTAKFSKFLDVSRRYRKKSAGRVFERPDLKKLKKIVKNLGQGFFFETAGIKSFYFQKAILTNASDDSYKHFWSHLFVEHSKLCVSLVLLHSFVSISLFVSSENSAVYLLEQLQTGRIALNNLLAL